MPRSWCGADWTNRRGRSRTWASRSLFPPLRADRSHFNELFDFTLVEAGQQSEQPEDSVSMSISSVSTAPVIVPLNAGSPKPQDTAPATSDTGTIHQPTPPAPLPPGQGTRVDQLV